MLLRLPLVQVGLIGWLVFCPRSEPMNGPVALESIAVKLVGLYASEGSKALAVLGELMLLRPPNIPKDIINSVQNIFVNMLCFIFMFI